jgi:formylglycine-generating enzyme required for sulfatase activity
MARLLDLYRSHPDAGIHGAVAWTLRQWKQQSKVDEIDAALRGQERGNRHWYLNGQGQTFVLIEGPLSFRLGSPAQEPDRFPDETPRRRVIPHRFAIAAQEVSVAQYQRFVRENPQFGVAQSYLDKYSPEPDGPMIAVSWFGAVAYCNWLSKEEGLPRDQWCYLPNQQGEYDKEMAIPADMLKRTGYRLPTDAEWEYACRAGSLTSRYYGFSLDLLGTYAWYAANSQDRARRYGLTKPNDLGLFDMLGNAYEWCQNRQEGNEHSPNESIDVEIIDMAIHRLLRGGTFNYRPASVRSALRDWYAPADRSANFGFRPSRTYN